MNIKKSLLIALFILPATGFCAVNAASDADSNVTGLDNQQLLKEQLLELKLIRQELQVLNANRKEKTCVYASQRYADGKQIKDVPVMANKVCKNGEWIEKDSERE
ncbi:hypothetical protein AAG029_004441 [Salmonella enterica]